MNLPHNVMVISHPDDDLFAYQYQRYHKSFWTIICVSGTPERLKELNRWQSYLSGVGCTLGYTLIAHKIRGCGKFNNIDNPDDFNDNVSSWDQKQLSQDLLEEFQTLPEGISTVLTHNYAGEYGHPHHKSVNKAVRDALAQSSKWPYIGGIHTFGFGLPHCPTTITGPAPIKKVREFYASQAWVVDSISLTAQTFNFQYVWR